MTCRPNRAEVGEPPIVDLDALSFLGAVTPSAITEGQRVEVLGSVEHNVRRYAVAVHVAQAFVRIVLARSRHLCEHLRPMVCGLGVTCRGSPPEFGRPLKEGVELAMPFRRAVRPELLHRRPHVGVG